MKSRHPSVMTIHGALQASGKMMEDIRHSLLGPLGVEEVELEVDEGGEGGTGLRRRARERQESNASASQSQPSTLRGMRRGRTTSCNTAVDGLAVKSAAAGMREATYVMGQYNNIQLTIDRHRRAVRKVW
jgi:hypothetical protein